MATIPHSSGACLIGDMCRLNRITALSRLSTLLPFCSFPLSTHSSSLPAGTAHLSICLFTRITTYQSFYNRSSFLLFGKLNHCCVMLSNVSNGNTRTICEFCSKVTVKKPELCHSRRSGVFITNFEQISHIVQIILLFLMFLERMYYQRKEMCLFIVKSQFIKNQKWKNQNLKSIMKKMFCVIKK